MTTADKESIIRVAFQGERGAFSEEAIFQHFDGRPVQTLPRLTFEAIFESIEDGEADFGILPVENSVAGSINKAYDLLLEHDLRVWSEVYLRVRHHLLAAPGTTLADVKIVKSHPQALAQCEGYLNKMGFKAIPAYDTAGSAKMLSEQPEPGVAVIASALTAQLYGLEILATGIEDLQWNITRFFIVGHGAPSLKDGPTKTSLVFAVPHRPRALYDCLGEFAQRGLNLTKLESRPRRNRPWQYVFYLDCEGDWREPPCREAIMGLLSRAVFVKLLGSYRAAEKPRFTQAGQEHILQI